MADPYDLLVIDDEPVVLDAARKILAAEGLRADLALDRDMAAEKLERRPYRAVLCDLVLPQVTGFELVERIRDRLPEVPLILITGYATMHNATEGFRRGVFDFIPKPFDYGELAGVVQRALEVAGRGPARDASAPVRGDGRRRLRLGRHAWVELADDGSAEVGLGETFATLNGAFEELELPEVGAVVLQGNRCVRWTTRGRLVHRLWAPLSGTVLETSTVPFGDSHRRDPGSSDRSWVLRVTPTNLDLEVGTLTPERR